MIPPLIHPNVKSGAERKMFAVIRDAPGTDDWVCLHSLALARHDTKRRGEVDFLLLTRKGVFFLEVKGGRVAREGGVWVFTDRWGDQARKYESPYEQASSAMFSLEKDLQSRFGKDQRLGRLLFGYGVLFPDIEFNEYGTEGDQAITYDFRDRSSPFTTFVERMAKYSREHDQKLRYSPTEKDIEDLTEFLRGDFDRIPPLGARLDETTGRLLELTREQYHVLDAYDSPLRPRLVIQGGAGTGKTLLAIECAIRETQRAKGKTLFLSYNRLLVAYIQRAVRERGVDDRLKVWRVYALLDHLIGQSTFGPEFTKKREGQPDEILYGTLYPEYAKLATMEKEPEQYDTLVIDEGQDFLSRSLLDVLDGLLVSGMKDGRWRVFCDVNNQGAVYGRYEEAAFTYLLERGREMDLPVNRRNTKEIATETTMLAVPRVPSVAYTPGMPVQYLWFDAPADQPKRLKNQLYRLYQEGVKAGRITVLTTRSFSDSCLPAVSDPPLEPVTEQNVYDVVTGVYGSTTYSTVSAFKGLENDVVILADVENLDGDWWRSVVYVGMSRARAGLYVLVPTSLRPTYEVCLRRSLEAALSSGQTG